ncbi:MAG TPA: hypothetical protein VFE27_21005 [Acidobacteriaceae bacterium]|nr:hypothetical protein [Acidobacteriaceae bacterium]
MIGQSPSDMVQVAPGIMLPSKGSVWATDSSRTVSPVQLYRSPVTVNRHLGKNLAGQLGGSFLYRPSMTIELHAAHAETRLTMQNPVFYVRQAETFEGEGDLRPGTANDTLTSELVIVRLNSSKDKRVEESKSTNGFGTGAKRKLNEVSITREKLDSGWLKLSPVSPLEPGEYAIVSLPNSAAFFSEYLYDFGVDAAQTKP